jgi:hypothetical protein
MIVVTVATERNSFLDEWEYTLKKLNYRYTIIGLGEKWEGFQTKNKVMNTFLKRLNPDELIVFTDSYDLLFLQSPNVLLKKYRKLCPNWELLIGYEQSCVKESCDYSYIKSCGFKEHNYLNTGFIMGKNKDVLKGYQHSIDNNITDDQRGWGNYLSKYCPKVYIDVNSEIVLNLFPEGFISNMTLNPIYKNFDIKNDILYNKDDKNYPVVVHIPIQDFDIGKRSETIRNALIPNREPINGIKYFNRMMKRVGDMIKAKFVSS